MPEGNNQYATDAKLATIYLVWIGLHEMFVAKALLVARYRYRRIAMFGVVAEGLPRLRCFTSQISVMIQQKPALFDSRLDLQFTTMEHNNTIFAFSPTPHPLSLEKQLPQDSFLLLPYSVVSRGAKVHHRHFLLLQLHSVPKRF